MLVLTADHTYVSVLVVVTVMVMLTGNDGRGCDADGYSKIDTICKYRCHCVRNHVAGGFDGSRVIMTGGGGTWQVPATGYWNGDGHHATATPLRMLNRCEARLDGCTIL